MGWMWGVIFVLDLLFELLMYLTNDIPDEKSKKRKIYIIISIIVALILAGGVIYTIFRIVAS